MRRALVIAPAVTLFMLIAGTASASKPTREIIPVDQTLESEDCGFLVSIHNTGTIIRDTYTYKDGHTRLHESYPGFLWDMTNVDTGTEVVVGLPGPATIVTNVDGSSTFSGTGPWSWFGNPETGEPGIFLTMGRFVFTFDAEGNQTSFSIVGTISNLCTELAA